MKSSRGGWIGVLNTSIWRTIPFLVLIVGSAGLTGCSPFRGLRENLAYNDGMNDFVMGWRNSVWARQAWEERKYEHVDEPQFVSFGQGFRDGYADVAGGGNGCVPGLPPRHMWTWKYQTGEGQAKVAAWFAGYPYGARAAAEDGAGNFQQIQVSHVIEAQYSPEFRAGKCPGCDPTTMPGAPGIEVIPSPADPTIIPNPNPVPNNPGLDAPAPLVNPMTRYLPPAVPFDPGYAMPPQGVAQASYTIPAYSRPNP